MTLTALRDDALRTTGDGFELRLGLPWIRSLPLAGLLDLEVVIDGEVRAPLAVLVDDRRVAPGDLGDEQAWWFIEDRLVVAGSGSVGRGSHEVTVAFRLDIPYLAAGPDGPLSLPFRFARSLSADAGTTATTKSELASTAEPTRDHPPADHDHDHGHDHDHDHDQLPAGWTLTASAFNWTPQVVRGERSAADAAIEVASDIEPAIELEAGQVWRGFPAPGDHEVDRLRERLDAVGGRVSIVGASIDDYAPDGHRRGDAERLAFLLPQLRAAARLGAEGVRLPLGQAGPELLRRVQPILHELDLVWFEEAQGHQTPQADPAAFDAIGELDDPHIRVLVDISMLMPALPTSYLAAMRAGGLAADLLARLERDWRDPATHGAVIDALRSGSVPGPIHTMFMNLLVRFGRSDAADLRGILPLVAGIHLKFWDLDDTDARVSAPIRDIVRELRSAGFAGTLCSEWGGHEWLDDDPAVMTLAHLALARRALAPA